MFRVKPISWKLSRHELCYPLASGRVCPTHAAFGFAVCLRLAEAFALLVKLADSIGHGGAGRFKSWCSHLCLPGSLQ